MYNRHSCNQGNDNRGTVIGIDWSSELLFSANTAFSTGEVSLALTWWEKSVLYSMTTSMLLDSSLDFHGNFRKAPTSILLDFVNNNKEELRATGCAMSTQNWESYRFIFRILNSIHIAKHLIRFEDFKEGAEAEIRLVFNEYKKVIEGASIIESTKYLNSLQSQYLIRDSWFKETSAEARVSLNRLKIELDARPSIWPTLEDIRMSLYSILTQFTDAYIRETSFIRARNDLSYQKLVRDAMQDSIDPTLTLLVTTESELNSVRGILRTDPRSGKVHLAKTISMLLMLVQLKED